MLPASDLESALRDCLAVQKGAPLSYNQLLADRPIRAGTSLCCCRINELPTDDWSIWKHPEGYVLLTGRRGEPFARYDRGVSFCPPDASPGSPGFTCRAVLASPHASNRPKRSAQATSRPKKLMNGASPASPASPLTGNQPYTVELHRWLGLATSSDFDASKPDVLHCCGHTNCICAAHLSFGTESQNTEDKVHHRKHPKTSLRSFAARLEG